MRRFLLALSRYRILKQHWSSSVYDVKDKGFSLMVGIATFLKLTRDVSEYIKPLETKCLVAGLSGSVERGEINGFYPTGLNGVDHLMCVVTPLFLDAIQTSPLSKLVVQTLLSAVLAFLVIASIESTRRSALWFVKWLPLTVLIGHIVGLSVAVAILWLPSFILTQTPMAAKTRSYPPLRPSLVYLIGLLQGLTLVVCYLLVETGYESKSSEFLVLLFNSVTVLLPFCWIPVAVGLHAAFGPLVLQQDVRKNGSNAANAVYEIYSVILAGYWAYSLWVYVSPYLSDGYFDKIGIDISQLLFATTPSVANAFAATRFMLLEIPALILSLSVWAYYEEGLAHAIYMLAGCLLIGPGSAVLSYASGREKRLGSVEIKQSVTPKKKKRQ